MKLCSAKEHHFLSVNNTNRIYNKRIHILQINTSDIINILDVYPEVKRIVIPENLSKTANLVLKNRYIKWYVTNINEDINVLKFFRQHNKIAGNFTVQEYNIEHVLSVCELCFVNTKILADNLELFKEFAGDVILL